MAGRRRLAPEAAPSRDANVWKTVSIRGSAAIRKRPGPSVLTVAVPWIRISFSTLPSSGISIRPRERSQSRRPVRSGIVPATTRTGRVLVIVRASGSIAISPPDGIRSSPLTRTRPVATFARPFGLKQAAIASTSPKRTLDFAQVGAGGPPPSHSAPATGVGVAVGDGVAVGPGVAVSSGRDQGRGPSAAAASPARCRRPGSPS